MTMYLKGGVFGFCFAIYFCGLALHHEAIKQAVVMIWRLF